MDQLKKFPQCDISNIILQEECVHQHQRLEKKLSGDIKFSVIRDPIHGLIEVDSKYMHIIDTCKYQRLRRIIQMGSVHLAYPSSYHTRFDHSLGVFHISKLMSRSVDYSNCPPDVQKDIKEKINLVPLAGLVHDLCHGPFSHVSEKIWEIAAEKSGKNELIKEPPHEHWTSQYLKENNCVTDIIKKYCHITDDELRIVAEMIIKRGSGPDPRFQDDNIPMALHQMINGSFDADKMDYYIRDATTVGVPYGNIDLDRILKFLTIQKGRESGTDIYELCVRDRALLSIQNMMMARELLYPSVVLHKVPVIAESMMIQSFKKIFDEGLYNTDNLSFSNPFNFAEIFRQMDDFQAWDFLRKIKDEKIQYFIECILNRKLLKSIDIKEDECKEDQWVKLKTDNPKSIGEIQNEIAADAKVDQFYIIVNPKLIRNGLKFKVYQDKKKKIVTYQQSLKLDIIEEGDDDKVVSESPKEVKLSLDPKPIVSVSVYCRAKDYSAVLCSIQSRYLKGG